MKRLWLLRHAKSSHEDPYLADHVRPLAPRGRKAAKRVGRWALENGVRPDLTLCSTATRARSTLDLFAVDLALASVSTEAGLYYASAPDLLARLRTVPSELSEVLVVGHNPALHDLLRVLAPPGTDALPTGALAELRLAIDAWIDVRPGCAELGAFVLPRALPP